MGGTRYYASLLSKGPIVTLAPLIPFIPNDTGSDGTVGRPAARPSSRNRGGHAMDTVTRPLSLLPRARAFSLTVENSAASAASEHTSFSPPTPAGRLTAISGGTNGSEAAGGAVGIVAAGGIGSGWAGIEGRKNLSSWRSEAHHGVHGLSGRTGRRVRDRVRQNRINLGNVATPECECMSMYGIEGRVVPGAIAVAGYSVSSVLKVSTLRAGEPARGVMGGLLQPTTPSVEPPVSFLNGFSGTPTTTAPAPIGALAGEVSPRTSAVGAAVSAEPAGRKPTTG